MITADISKAVFQGNGQAVHFPFSFKVWDSTQLRVEVTDSSGVTQSVTNFTAHLTEHGGTLTYMHDGGALPQGYSLAILRNMPFTQEVDLISGTRFDPQVIEEQLDRATAERQQLREAVERSVKTDVTSDQSPEMLINTLRANAATAVEKAAEASASALRAEQSQSESVASAQEAQVSALASSQSANVAQAFAAQAGADVSGAIAQVTAEGEKQVALVYEEGLKQQNAIDAAVVSGAIIAFSGSFGGTDFKRPIDISTGKVYENWALCDGTNGTPNLVNKFIYGGNGHNQGVAGGSTVTQGHTLSIAQMPQHSHAIMRQVGSEGDFGPYLAKASPYYNLALQPNIPDSVHTNGVGSTQSHSHNQNLPPYYTLAYIMKIA